MAVGMRGGAKCLSFSFPADSSRALVSQFEQHVLREQILETKVANSMLSVRSATDRQAQYQLIQKLHRMYKTLQE